MVKGATGAVADGNGDAVREAGGGKAGVVVCLVCTLVVVIVRESVEL